MERTARTGKSGASVEKRSSGKGGFRELSVPGFGRVRSIKEGVFNSALDQADAKLKSGRRAPAKSSAA